MTQPTTPAKSGLRARYKELERLCRALKLNSEHATIVANAMFWKHGYTNRDDIKKVVDEYMKYMEDKLLPTQKGSENMKAIGKVSEETLEAAIRAGHEAGDDSSE